MGVAELLLKRKQELAAKNLADGMLYLEAFCKNEKGILHDSGVAYKIVKEGVGAKPTLTDTVTCHYHGTNIQGGIFDSSVERGVPATFQINKLIKGWQNIMPLLNVGSKAILVIPAHLAYGEEQKSKEIGPNSTLIFEVELLEIV
ncbi:FKBP-type peptidyl-prolyl cis-trans isomerase [Flavobacterium sp. xlx-214]|uniref:FKBP-type peptidyl-prolyl cis-trans isomerase n=1 Tax=unclassified Flavobacterium TaxID=196869 RepID=UPI0013D6B43C|nr:MULTISPECIES: FKBP-type peptidyl-prolyl cis-trans isomerase [unclassified Flavobacterium]MBA5791878.1 FKBP-type peptidyl-prolyl cis-trans isomerase [Flavobacterium sp. xlx-221]QMI83114.1 FKBP-type peptidyl-prolyl cis-trans isomerase [Flavobacterium sp. xlx-214]